MSDKKVRAEILVDGIVQGVGFRWYVTKHARQLGLKGFTKNLYTGEVLTVVEGPEYKVKELFKKIKIGPSHAYVKNANIKFSEPSNEFSDFEVRY